MSFMCDEAESLFQPKQVFAADNWLYIHSKDKGQPFKKYKFTPVSPMQKTIYIFQMDSNVCEKTLAKQVEYCKAYFFGLHVKLLKPGDVIPGQAASLKGNAK